MTAQGNIYGINGPIIYLKGDSGFQMNEMVYVGTGRLVDEWLAAEFEGGRHQRRVDMIMDIENR